MSRSRLLLLVLILLLAVLGLAMYFLLRSPAVEIPQVEEEVLPPLESLEQLEEETGDEPLPPPMEAGSPILTALELGDEHVLGGWEDKVSLVGYLSYQDPNSRFAYQAIREFQEANPGVLNFVFRHYAMQSQYPLAMSGALATECASSLDADPSFWHFADRLFEDDEIAEGDFDLLADERGIDRQELHACMSQFDLAEDIRDKMYQGWRWGFTSIPAFFLVHWKTGEVRLVEGAHGKGFMDRLLKEML